MNDFYYDLLNIGVPKQNYEQHIDFISKIIQNEVSEIETYVNDKEGLCKVASYNILSSLKEKKYSAHLYNINEIFENSIDHAFIITNFKDEQNQIHYILVDATFSQFINNDKELYKLESWPSDILDKTTTGTIIKQSLINNYMVNIDDEFLKCYLGSFINEPYYENIDVGIDDLILDRKEHRK